jgi:hypothetical protein
MKDSKDAKTVDLVAGKVIRQRGRPASGTAMTQAERQKAYRDRLKEKGQEEITVAVSAETAAALRRHVEFKDLTLGEALTKIIADRLLRKR